MAVTTDQYTQRKGGTASTDKYPMKAAIKCPHLTMAFVDATTGLLTNIVDTGNNKFAGVVKGGDSGDGIGQDNTNGSNGDMDAELYHNGKFLLTGSGFTQADVGKKAYATDNYVVGVSASNTTYIGTVKEYVSATQIWVEIDTQLP